MKLLIVTDAWSPQTNGVVTTLKNTIAECEARGHSVSVLEPGAYRTIGIPGYAEIRVCIDPFDVPRRIMNLQPDAVHIATEGPLGLAARRFLVRHGVPFTTSLHTKFPEYVQARTGAPLSWGYGFLRWFHGAAAATLVTTQTQKAELEAWGLDGLVVWGRGVDTQRFAPVAEAHTPPDSPQERRLVYVGRLAVEKNVEAFLDCDVPGRKVVVGDGPQRAALEARFPDATFLGYRYGEELAHAYASADVFVFPSRTDTFGLVMLEANACGAPVAGYPVTGPADVVVEGVNGALDEDLGAAIERAARCDRERCRSHAEDNSWSVIADRFLQSAAPWRPHEVRTAPAYALAPA